jgi:hypothetical protein
VEVLTHVQSANLYLKPETLRSYQNVLNLAADWGATSCEELFSLPRFGDWLAWLKNTPEKRFRRRSPGSPMPLRSPRTVKQRMLTARTLWRVAYKRGLCSQAPPALEDLPTIRLATEDPVAWSIEEFRLILETSLEARPVRWWTSSHWFTILSCYFVTVERYSALASCEKSHLDSSNCLRVLGRSTKTGTPGTHSLPQWLADMIRRLPPIPDDAAAWKRSLLWPMPFNLATMRRHYRRDILLPAGLPADRDHLFHCLRRTGITELVNEVGLEAASRHARHSTPHITTALYVSDAKLRAPSGSVTLAKSIEGIA